MDIISEIEKLPNTLTREQLINWFLENIDGKGDSREITTGELIYIARKCGKKIEGHSSLIIHLTKEEEEYYIRNTKANTSQTRANKGTKIPQSERGRIEDMYWRCGMTLKEIAKVYKCVPSTISNFMKECNLSSRGRGVNTIASMKTTRTLTGI